MLLSEAPGMSLNVILSITTLLEVALITTSSADEFP